MVERFPTVWLPVGLMQVPTLTRKVPDLALGRARRPGMLSSSALPLPHRRSAAEEKEDEGEEKEEGMEASDSDISMDEPTAF